MEEKENPGVAREFVRSIVRGTYALQALRIQAGNRLVANFRSKLGIKPSEKEGDDSDAKAILDQLRESYFRITDGIAVSSSRKKKTADEENDGESEDIAVKKLPSMKKFTADGLITEYAELVLVNQYISILNSETQEFKYLAEVLKGVPVYTQFLSKISGMGPQMAGVLISEIDIRRANYPSSLWQLAGVGTKVVGYYVDNTGKEHHVRAEDVEIFYDQNDTSAPMVVGDYVVKFKTVGDSRRDWCLVKRPYVTRDGETKYRDSITFNPWLKTKLLGVIAMCFLKQSRTYVDGESMGVAKRMTLAKSKGFKVDTKSAVTATKQVDDFLRAEGYEVEFEPGQYARMYYNYRVRLDNNREHDDKTDLHKHRMAVRFMMKNFLSDYYVAARQAEGLFVSPSYGEAKLGQVHGEAKAIPNRTRLQNLQYLYEEHLNSVQKASGEL